MSMRVEIPEPLQKTLGLFLVLFGFEEKPANTYQDMSYCTEKDRTSKSSLETETGLSVIMPMLSLHSSASR